MSQSFSLSQSLAWRLVDARRRARGPERPNRLRSFGLVCDIASPEDFIDLLLKAFFAEASELLD